MKQLDSEQQRVMREAYERVFGWSGPSLSHDPLYAAGAALLESQDERIADLKYLLRNAIEYFELVQRGIKLPLTFAGQLKQYRAAVEAQCPAPAEGAKVEARHMISVVHPTTEEYRDRRKELMFKLNFIDEALPQLKEEAERDPCYPHPAAPRAESQDTVPKAVNSPPRYNITQTATNKPHHLNAHMVEHPHGDYMESRYYDELCAGAGELLRALEFNWVDCGPEKNCFECDMKRTAIARAKEAGIE